MKKYAFLLFATMTLGLVGCNNEPTPDEKPEVAPTIALEKGFEEVNAVSFSVVTTNASRGALYALGGYCRGAHLGEHYGRWCSC